MEKTNITKYLIAIVIIAVIILGVLLIIKINEDETVQLIREIENKSGIKSFEDEFPDSNVIIETFDIQEGTTLLAKLKIDCSKDIEPGMFYKTTAINTENTEKQVVWSDYATKEVICEYRELIINQRLPEPILILEANPSEEGLLEYTFELSEDHARKIANNILVLDIEFEGQTTGIFKFNRMSIDLE
ncbi:unnamed protein product, partial [marine sediment metagenome]